MGEVNLGINNRLPETTHRNVFDSPITIAQMEELIKELNSPVNQSSSERIQELQRRIQQLQRQKSGWDQGFDLLRSDDQAFRFYGALTLTIKINADWENDGLSEDENARRLLLEGLLNVYAQLVNVEDAPFVILKLCSTITAYFIKDNNWHGAVKHVAASLLRGQYVSLEQLSNTRVMKELMCSMSFQQLRGTLWFASTLVEDISRLGNGTSGTAPLANRLAMNSADIWRATEFCLDVCVATISTKSSAHQAPNPRLLEFEAVELAKTAMTLLLLCLEYLPLDSSHQEAETVPVVDFANRCLDSVFACFSHILLQDVVIKTLTGVADSCPSIFKRTSFGAVAVITDSSQAGFWLAELQQGDFSPEAVQYVEFLIALINLADLSSPAYLDDKVTLASLLTLKELMHCEGTAVIEDEICQLVLEALAEVAEQYNDWTEAARGNIDMKALLAEVCLSAITKAEFPVTELDSGTSSWDADDRARFQDFQNDVADFLVAAYVAIGSSIIETLALRAVSSNVGPIWSAFEANLFCLLELFDTMTHDMEQFDPIIHAILNSAQWAAVTSHTDSSPSKARQTAIRFVSQQTGYLRRNANSLIPCLDFLFCSLEVPSSAQISSRAIQSLCFSERSLLVEALPQFMGSLPGLKGLEPTVRHKIYGAVAAIIQALPTELDKTEPLSNLLNSVSSVARQAPLEETSPDRAAVVVDLLQALVSIGKGLRSPADVVIDLESSDPVSEEANFWISGPGHQIQRDALSLCTYILTAPEVQLSREIVEAACDFVKSGYTEDDPSPFKFSTAISVNFLTSQMYLDSPNIDAVMGCASSFLASTEPNMESSLFVQLMDPILSSFQTLTAQYRNTGDLGPSDFPSSAIDFLTRIMPKWLLLLFGLNTEDQMAAVFDLALIMLATSDTLPRRIAASFFATVFDLTGHNTTLKNQALTKFSTILSAYTAPIVATVLKLIAGECARSEIEAVTEILRKLVSKQTPITRRLLKDAMAEQGAVLSLRAYTATTLQQRLRFIAQAEALRGARKTIELAKEFWIATRGDAFGYIT